MKLHPYVRTTHYYETDRMGIIHHANYLHFFEEARIDLFRQLGLSYDHLESLGVQIPVLSSHCEYKKAVQFDERLHIYVDVKTYTGLRLTLSYRIERAETREICTLGETQHCFVSAEDFRPLRVSRACPEVHAALSALLAP